MLVDLQVHLGVNVVLALHHVKFDVNPKVNRLQLANEVLILTNMISYLLRGVDRQVLAVLLPELPGGFL